MARIVLAATILVVCACSDDEGDTHHPATLGDPCTADDVCRAPFSCLPAGASNRFCTKTCAADADCPTWEETGHCAGLKRGTCRADKVCEPYVCK